MSKIVEANEKIAEVVVDGYKKIETGVVEGYKKIEDGVVEGFKKIESGAVDGFKKVDSGRIDKMADAVTGAYQKVEDAVVGAYKKMEDGFVEKHLVREGETVEEAKARIKKEQEERDAQAKDRNKVLSQEDGNMTDCVVNKEDAFVYTYSAQKSKEIEKIRSKYLPKEESKLEKLMRLDKQTEKKGQAVSIALGVIGSLLLGVGMCCTMVWNVGIVMMVIGIIIGIFGMGIMGLAYPAYKKLTARERAKIAEQMIALSNELL